MEDISIRNPFKKDVNLGVSNSFLFKKDSGLSNSYFLLLVTHSK